MCNPAALPFIEGAAVLVSQGIAGNQQADYQEKVFEANKASADANAIRNYMTLQTRQEQERVSSNQAIERATLEATGARATARVSAGESGVAGNSVTALDQEFREVDALLSEEERILFRRLGIFAGGWTWEAAEAVVNGDGAVDVLEHLTSLVDKNLVRLSYDHGNDTPRFTLPGRVPSAIFSPTASRHAASQPAAVCTWA